MIIKVKKNGLTKIIFLDPTTIEEEDILIDFCRIDTPLEATIKRTHAHIFCYIEIRKET